MSLYILLYFVFLICILIGCIVVVFHLMRYSLDKKIATRTTIAFITITALLILLNLYFFAQIPFADLSTGSF